MNIHSATSLETERALEQRWWTAKDLGRHLRIKRQAAKGRIQRLAYRRLIFCRKATHVFPPQKAYRIFPQAVNVRLDARDI